MLSIKFGWNWLRRFGGEDLIMKFVNIVSLFSLYLPLEQGLPLHFDKIEFP